MKLLVLSDLHVEIAPFTAAGSAPTAADVIVLAGDVHRGLDAVSWIRSVWPRAPVVYVAGNHEFYHGHWDLTLQLLRDHARAMNVQLLEDSEVVLDGVRFLGCTLWTDFELLGNRERAMATYERGLNDCRMIRAGRVHGDAGHIGERCLRARDVLERHRVSREWLQKQLRGDRTG